MSGGDLEAKLSEAERRAAKLRAFRKAQEECSWPKCTCRDGHYCPAMAGTPFGAYVWEIEPQIFGYRLIETDGVNVRRFFQFEGPGSFALATVARSLAELGRNPNAIVGWIRRRDLHLQLWWPDDGDDGDDGDDFPMMDADWTCDVCGTVNNGHVCARCNGG